MRWTRKRSKVGDRRVRKRFAFLPTECRDEVWVWLEFYEVMEECRQVHGGGKSYWSVVSTRARVRARQLPFEKEGGR